MKKMTTLPQKVTILAACVFVILLLSSSGKEIRRYFCVILLMRFYRHVTIMSVILCRIFYASYKLD